MNKHEIFAKVKAHLLAQGTPASIGGTCMYRTPNGLMCAVGCLIPDGRYNPEAEQKIITSESVKNMLPFELDVEKERLLLALQNCHDFRDPSDWETELENIANLFGITEAA